MLIFADRAEGLRATAAAFRSAEASIVSGDRARGALVVPVLTSTGCAGVLAIELPQGRVKLTIGKARDKVRWMPLSPKVVALFANLKPCDSGWLFPWRTKSGVYKWLTPLCRRSGVKVTPHQFRHALGEEAMDAEVDVVTLTEMGAWSSLNSARRYARVSRKRMEEADRQRAAEAIAAAGREMVAEDIEGPAIAANVVPLKKTA